MQERLRILLYLTVFWMTYMIIARVLFMVYNFDFSSDLSWSEKSLALLYGLRMDASISGYFLAFAGLLLSITAVRNSLWLSRTLTVVMIISLLVCSAIVTVDMELYRHWGFRLNTTPFMYVGAMGSIEPWLIVRMGAIFIFLVAAGTFLYVKKIHPRLEYLGETRRVHAVWLLLITALFFLPIRGSFTVAPMNTGFVYFHNTKPFANHSAVNVVWNFLYSVKKGTNQKYPENFYDKTETKKVTDSLYAITDDTVSVLKTKKPNIILVVIESFTADVIEPLGGVKGIAPNLSALCSEGILFDEFYASGDRTDKGLIAVLSGYPAQPQTSIIKLPNKTAQLPQINTHLRRLGYHTSFLYGGDIDFANFRSYLNTGGFDHITTLDDFPSDQYTSKWGVHDHLMFNKAFEQLQAEKSPFFKVILTLSSHEPFDVPMEPYIKGTSQEELFLNSCHYTDKSIAKFIEDCKKQPWWDNTLMIITADHGHRHPGNKELKNKRRFKIPFLMLGGAVKKDTVIHSLGSQTDIANTLLGQLDVAQPEFVFSRNLFQKNTQPFAAYFFNDGYGFLLPGDKFVVYDNPGKRFLVQENVTEHDINLSKAYQQRLYSDYNKRGEK